MSPEPGAPGPWWVRGTVALAAVLVAGAAAAGIGMRATYGAQVAVDEPQYLLTTMSLVSDGDLDIADELAAGVWRDFHAVALPEQTALRADGSRLSPHNPLLPILLVPAVAAGQAVGAPAWVSAKAGLCLLSAALAGLLVWTAIRRFDVPPVTAAVAVTVFAESPPLSVYATQLYPEVPAALAVGVAVAALSAPAVRRSHAVLAMVAVVALPWLAVKYAPVAVVLVAWLLWRVRADRRLLISCAAALTVAAVGYAVFNQLVYGGWTPYAAGDHFVGGELTAVGSQPDYAARTQRLLGLLVDRGFGLVAWQPAWLLGLVAVGWAAAGGANRMRRGGQSGWLLATVAAGWATATWVALTMHGWWWPGRQVVVVLPVLVLLVAAWAGRNTLRTAVVAVVGAVGVGAHAALVWATAWSDPVRHTLIVDFARTGYPPYRALRVLLPDLMAPSASTVWVYGSWVVVALALVGLGLRTALATRVAPRLLDMPVAQRVPTASSPGHDGP